MRSRMNIWKKIRYRSCVSTTTLLTIVTISTLFSSNNLYSAEPKGIKHFTVYRENRRFGGWPANHGMSCQASGHLQEVLPGSLP